MTFGSVFILFVFLRRGLVASFPGHKDSVYCVRFSPDGDTIVSAGKDRAFMLWSVKAKKQLGTSEELGDRVYEFSISPSGRLLAAPTQDGAISIIDTTSRQRTATFWPRLRRSLVYSVAFSPDEKLLAAAGDDRCIWLWDIATGAELKRFDQNTGIVSLSFSPQGDLLASRGQNGNLVLWSIRDGRKRIILDEFWPGWIYSLSFSPDGKLVAGNAFDFDVTVRLWDVATGRTVLVLPTKARLPISSIAFSPDGSIVAAACLDGILWFWNSESGEVLCTKRIGVAWSISFSPDGCLIATGHSNGSLKIWSVSELLLR